MSAGRRGSGRLVGLHVLLRRRVVLFGAISTQDCLLGLVWILYGGLARGGTMVGGAAPAPVGAPCKKNTQGDRYVHSNSGKNTQRDRSLRLQSV